MTSPIDSLHVSRACKRKSLFDSKSGSDSESSKVKLCSSSKEDDGIVISDSSTESDDFEPLQNKAFSFFSLTIILAMTNAYDNDHIKGTCSWASL